MANPSDVVISAARLGGRSIGITINFWRDLKKTLSPFRSDQGNLEQAIRAAIVAEIKRLRLDLSERDIDKLVERIASILGDVLSGNMDIDAVLHLGQALQPGGALSEFLVTVAATGETGKTKSEMLRRIFEENLQLWQAE